MTTAAVASRIGGRTSFTARRTAARVAPAPRFRWRWMFSTSTIGSSTTRPRARISEERHAIDRETEPPVDREGQPEGQGHRERDDDTLAEAERQEQQRRHDHHRLEQRAQQLVDLVVRRLALIAGHDRVDALRQMGRREGREAFVEGARDGDRVGAALLRDRDVDGGMGPARALLGGRCAARVPGIDARTRARAESDPGRHAPLVGAVDDRRDIPQMDRGSVDDVDDRAAQRLGALEAGAGFDGDVAIGLVEAAGQGTHVRERERPGDVEGRGPTRGEGLGIEQRGDDPRPPAVDRRRIRARHVLESDLELFGNPPEDVVVDLGRIAPECRDPDRHVVDLERLDDPARDALRNPVDVGVQLRMDLEQALLAILADEEADGHGGAARLRDGVDMLDAVDLGQQLLDAGRDVALDLDRREAGRLDEHVGERHDDLGLFLPRRRPERDDARDRGDRHRETGRGRGEEIADDSREPAVFVVGGAVHRAGLKQEACRGRGHRRSGDASQSGIPMRRASSAW